MTDDERTGIAHWMYHNQYNYQVIKLGSVYVIKFSSLEITQDIYRLLYEDNFNYVVQICMEHMSNIPYLYYKFSQMNSDGSLTFLYDSMEENYYDLKKLIKLRKLKIILN
jgi:hypothetical protein